MLRVHEREHECEACLGHVPLGAERRLVLRLPPPAGLRGDDLSGAWFTAVSGPRHAADVSVSPRRGVLLEDGAQICVTVRPTQYITLIWRCQIFLPYLTPRPFLLTVRAQCKPGLKVRALKDRFERLEAAFQFRHDTIKKYERRLIHARRQLYPPVGESQEEPPEESAPAVEPPVELLSPMGKNMAEEDAAALQRTRQLCLEVKELRRHNWELAQSHRRNLGTFEEDNSHQEAVIQAARLEQWWQYQESCRSVKLEDALRLKVPLQERRRLLVPVSVPLYPPVPELSGQQFSSLHWEWRRRGIERFIWAARTVLLQVRLLKRLAQLRVFVANMKGIRVFTYPDLGKCQSK